MNEEYAFKVSELNEQIQKCEKIVSSHRAKNTEVLLEVMLITLGILAGALIVGAIFESVAKAVVISLLIDGLAVFDKVAEMSRNHDMIKRNELKIAEIKGQLTEMTNKEYERIRTKSIAKEKKTTVSKENETKYSYNDSKVKETPKKKEVQIEFFDEKDFDDEIDKRNHKSR